MKANKDQVLKLLKKNNPDNEKINNDLHIDENKPISLIDDSIHDKSMEKEVLDISNNSISNNIEVANENIVSLSNLNNQNNDKIENKGNISKNDIEIEEKVVKIADENIKEKEIIENNVVEKIENKVEEKINEKILEKIEPIKKKSLTEVKNEIDEFCNFVDKTIEKYNPQIKLSSFDSIANHISLKSQLKLIDLYLDKIIDK